MIPANPTSPDRSAAQIALELDKLRSQNTPPQKSQKKNEQNHRERLQTISKILETHSVARLYSDARITQEIFLYKGKTQKYAFSLQKNEKLQELLSIVQKIAHKKREYNILPEIEKDDSGTRERFYSKFESLYGHLKLLIGSIDSDFDLGQENVKGCKILADVEKLISHFGVDEFFQDAQAEGGDPEISASM